MLYSQNADLQYRYEQTLQLTQNTSHDNLHQKDMEVFALLLLFFQISENWMGYKESHLISDCHYQRKKKNFLLGYWE